MSDEESQIEDTPDLQYEAGKSVPAPELPYRPPQVRSYDPGIGIIGCGAITAYHLKAYQAAGYRVVALCDLVRDRAVARRDEYYPQAEVCDDAVTLLRRDDVEVVDVTTHPPERPAIVEQALLADKHVLSQKPFVLELDVGRRLVELADRRGRKLAVNQNGRWAPHFSYMRQAVAAGLLGEVSAAHLAAHWDHTWVAGTEFEKVKHLILYDFAVHWFDIVRCLLPGKSVRRVYASTARSPRQTIMPALLAQALIELDGAQASLAFDADTPFGPLDETYVAGSAGSITSSGPSINRQHVTLHTAEGVAQPGLTGMWFPDGFHGTMAELLCSIEDDRVPYHNAADNLDSLALCFAAIASAERHEPVVPGTVQRLPD